MPFLVTFITALRYLNCLKKDVCKLYFQVYSVNQSSDSGHQCFKVSLLLHLMAELFTIEDHEIKYRKLVVARAFRAIITRDSAQHYAKRRYSVCLKIKFVIYFQLFLPM